MYRFVEPSNVRHLQFRGVPYCILAPHLHQCLNIESAHLDACGHLTSEPNELIDLKTCSVQFSAQIDVFRSPKDLLNNVTEMELREGELLKSEPRSILDFPALQKLRLSITTHFFPTKILSGSFSLIRQCYRQWTAPKRFLLRKRYAYFKHWTIVFPAKRRAMTLMGPRTRDGLAREVFVFPNWKS